MDLRKALTDNWPLKLASLLLAVTLWFYVTSKGQTELSITVPLELRNVPQGTAVVGDIASVVEVRLQGQERPLRDVASSRVVLVSVDLSRARLGENRIHLSADDVRRPSGVSVTYLAPAEITVRLERLVRRTVRLSAVVRGKPAPGYRVAGVSVTPPSITVEGPAGIIDSFSRLQTMPIDITGMKEPLTLEPRIDFRGRTVKVMEQDITVTVAIRKEHP